MALVATVSVTPLSADLLLGPVPLDATIATAAVVLTTLTTIPVTYVPQRIAKMTRTTVGP